MYDKEFSKCSNLYGIFYSVFNDEKGRTNVAQYPDNFFSKELFDQVSNYVITREEFANKVIVSEVNSMKVIGCLQFLENERYPRNKFMMNVCFVIKDTNISKSPTNSQESSRRSSNADYENYIRRSMVKQSTSTIPEETYYGDEIVIYENIVRHINRFFNGIEHETKQLFNADPDIIRNCLKTIYCDLKTSGISQYTWKGYATIFLKMSKDFQSNMLVEREQVPIFLVNNQFHIQAQDLTSQRLLSFIDGRSTLWELSKRSEIDLNVIRSCIQNLGYAGIIRTVAKCQLDARYMCLPKIRLLATDKYLQNKLMERFGPDDPTTSGDFDTTYIVRCIIQALSSLTPTTYVEDCARILQNGFLQIDYIKLIQYAETEGYIRRVHGFPLLAPHDSGLQAPFDEEMIELLDGSHNLEQISCLLNRSQPPRLDSSDHIYMFWK